MGVPDWLLNMMMGFLEDREMGVNYKGETTETKQLPGGGPQGTLLGLSVLLQTRIDLSLTPTIQDLD